MNIISLKLKWHNSFGLQSPKLHFCQFYRLKQINYTSLRNNVAKFWFDKIFQLLTFVLVGLVCLYEFKLLNCDFRCTYFMRVLHKKMWLCLLFSRILLLLLKHPLPFSHVWTFSVYDFIKKRIILFLIYGSVIVF